MLQAYGSISYGFFLHTAPVGPSMEAVQSQSSDSTVAIISGVVSVAVVIALIIAATVIIVITLILRSRTVELKSNKRLVEILAIQHRFSARVAS